MKDVNLFRSLDERALRDEEMRKKMKYDRILNSKKDKYEHALDIIIERIESYDDNRKSESIDYYYFNFEDRMVDSRMLERFFQKLKKFGCFSNFNRTNYASGTRFSFSEISISKLKKYKRKYFKSYIKIVIKNLKKFFKFLGSHIIVAILTTSVGIIIGILLSKIRIK